MKRESGSNPELSRNCK